MAKYGGTKAVWRARARVTAAVGVLSLLSTMVAVAPYSIEAQAAAVDTRSEASTAAESAVAPSDDSDDAANQALDIVDNTDVLGFAATAAQQDNDPSAAANTVASTPSSGDSTGATVASVPAIDPSVPAADLTVSVTPDRDPVLSESFVTYTVKVTNTGPSEAVNVVVTNTLPDFMSFIAMTGCWLANDTFPECHLNELPAGESRSYEVLALVGPGVVGDHTFAVAATSETADPDPTNNAAQTVSTVNIRATWRDVSATADLSIAKIDLVDPVPALGTITYRIVVSNAGPNAAVGVQVTETLPSGVTVVSTTGCRGSSGVPVCELGTIPPRQTRTFDVVVTADAGTTGDITNAVSVSTRSNDTNGANNTATETTTVNSAPIAVDDTATLPENAPATALDVTGNDTDFDNDVLTVTAIDDTGTIGVVALTGGIVTYDPNGAFDALAVGETATDTFTYDISDGNGGTDSATVTVTITGVNEAPVAVDDTATVGEDDPATAIDVVGNDTDANGDALTAVAVDDTGTTGAVAVNAGVVTYDTNGQFEALNTGDTATDTFGYTVDDGNSGTDNATVTVTVTGVNDAPTITSDGGGDTAALNFAENDIADVTDVASTDPEGDTEGAGLTYALSGPDAALFAVDANTGALTFLTPPDFEAPTDANTDNDYEVTVTVTDSGALTDTQDITVTVTNSNEAPVITSNGGGNTAAINFAENSTADITDVDATDPEGETENGGGLVYSLTGADSALFSITQAGVLTFATPPDFDIPGDANGDNDYEVTVTVTDSGALTDTQDITITVTNVNEAPVITSNGGGPNASINFAENSTADVTDVNATDPEGDTEGAGLSYALSGPDAGDFTIDANTGVLTFNTPPDFEAPTDANGDNDYEVTVTVTDSGALTGTQDITITVTNSNEAPTIVAPISGSVSENIQSLVNITSTDPEGETDNGGGLVYSLTGPDAALFTVSPAGVWAWVTAPDFENPLDVGADNVYNLTFVVTDSGGLTDSQVHALTVTNVNEAPVITSNGGGNTAAINFAENSTADVTDVNATDPEGDTEGAGLSYALSGPDAGDFTIDANTGALSFNTPPDFEAPADANTDNDYEVTVTVTDSGALTDTQDITITVTDGNEAPVITSNGGGNTAAINFAENSTADITDVNATDVEGETENGGGLVYALSGADSALFSITQAGVLTFNVAPDFDIPGDANGDNDYEVTVTVGDTGLLTDSQSITVTVTDVNEAPTLTAPTAVNVAENTTAVTTDGDVESTDPEGETEGTGLVYSLSGADALLFSISPAGEIAFLAPPNFEAPADVNTDNDYEVTVTVTDSGALTDDQAITITVTDQADPPVITSDGGGDTAAVSAAENQTAVTTVTATDDDSPTLTYSISGGADAGLLSIGSVTGVLTFDAAPDFDIAGDANGDNDYEVTVTVTDGALTDSQAITVTVTNINETPVITGGPTASTNFAENGTGTVLDIDSTDPDGETEGAGLTYALSGADAGDLSIDANTGVLTFTTPPDFENPADAGGDNIYNVTVTVTDSGTLTDTQAVTVTVTDQADPPVIISNGGGDTAAITVNQGDTAVTTVTATDDEGGALTYSISGGADQALFSIVTSTGVLTFNTAPTTDGTHVVIVTVTDPQTLTDSQTITVTVPANTAPVAVDDAYSVPVNVVLDAGTGTAGVDLDDADGVLTKGTDDSDPESNPLVVTGITGCADVTAPFTGCATTGGGQVTMNANGTFTYVSEPGETAASDTFGYILSDGQLTDTGTVTITFGETIWFIDDNGPGTVNTGTSNDPFKTIAQFNAATTDTFDLIRLHSGTYTGSGINLLSNQQLLGEGVALTSGGLTLAAGARPTIVAASSANGITLGSTNTVRGLNIGDTPTGYGIAGTTVGTPTIDTVTISGTGGIMSVNGGNLSNVTLGNSSSTSALGSGFLLQNVAGTFNPGGTVDITNSTSTAVQLSNNSGSSITFPDIDITNSTTNQPGITASGGGTLQVTTGTVNAGTATAVDINGLSIGVLLRRVDSVGGTTPGISLTNTTGFFTVAGSSVGCQTNVANCGGGSITGKTGNADGIVLNNVTQITLNDMNISNHTGNGISGTNVAGFVIDDSRITGNGDNLLEDEGGMKFIGLTGAATISNTLVSGSFEDDVSINNSSGTLSNLNVTNSTFGPNASATGDNGLQVVSSGSAAINVNVNGNAFIGSRSVMLFVDLAGSGGGTVNIGNTTANTFTQGQAALVGGGAIEVLASGSNTVTTNIRNNSILAGSNTFEGDTVVLGTVFGYSGTHNITFVNNQIGTSGVNGSAVNPLVGQGDSALLLSSNGTGTINALIDNNRIYDWNASGIDLGFDAEGPSDPVGGSVNLTVTNNTVTDVVGVAGLANAGIFIFGGDRVNVCLDVKSNTVNNPNPGVDAHEIAVDIFPNAPQTLVAPGITGAGDDAALDLLLRTNNGLAPGDVDVFVGATWAAAPASCTLPPP